MRQVGGFCLGTPLSSTHETDRHDISGILLQVVLSTITLTPPPLTIIYIFLISLFEKFR
jgi:hypothetical protein